MTWTMLERTPTITPSSRCLGTGLSETFLRLDKPLSPHMHPYTVIITNDFFESVTLTRV